MIFQNTGAKTMTKESKQETGEPVINPAEAAAESEFSNELDEPRWSVVSFESVAVSGLPYAEARNWLAKLAKQKVSGLCIVTDEAAARMAEKVIGDK
jgi:hypothetical protein